MSQRIAILGAGGFIGRHLYRRLHESGHRVVAAVRTAQGSPAGAASTVVSPFDSVADFAPLLDECDLIIHAASATTPSTSDAQPQLEGNLRTTLALIEALQAKPGIQLVYLSSGGTLYGDCLIPPDESAPLRPKSYHGAGKAAAELFIQAWSSQFDGAATIIRPSNVYGPGQPARPGFGIIPTAFSCALHGTPLSVWGDGSAVRDYLYIDDLVALIERIVSSSTAPGVAVFNASGESGIPLSALLDLIDGVTGRPLVRRHLAQRRVDVAAIVPSSARAKQMLGWAPQNALAQGLQQTWQWFTSRH